MLFQSRNGPLLSGSCGCKDGMASHRSGELIMLLMFVCERKSTAVPYATVVRLASSRDRSAQVVPCVPRGPLLEQVGWMR